MPRINPTTGEIAQPDSGDGSESTEERREPEDSIAEQDSTSESDPMTDMGSTNAVRRPGGARPVGGGGGGGGGQDADDPADAPSAAPPSSGDGGTDDSGQDADDPADAPSAAPPSSGDGAGQSPDPDPGGPSTAPSATGAPEAGDDSPSDVVDPENIEQSGEDLKGSQVLPGDGPVDADGGSDRPTITSRGTPDRPADEVDVGPGDFDETNPEYDGQVYSQVEDDLIDEEGASDIHYAETEGGLVARYEVDGQTQYASLPFEEDAQDRLSETASDLQQQANREQVASDIEGVSASDVRFVDGELSRGTREEIGQAALADEVGEETASELGIDTEFTYDEESGAVELTPYGQQELARENVEADLGGDVEAGEDFEVVYQGGDGSGDGSGESSVGVEYTSEAGQRAALREEYGEDAEIEQLGEGAFEVTALPQDAEAGDPSTAPSATGAPNRGGETVVVPFGEEGEQTVQDLQDAVNVEASDADGPSTAPSATGAPAAGDDAGATLEVVAREPREQVVSQLEEETGLTLEQSDVSFSESEEDGQTVVRGELDTDAQRRYRQEQAPGQGTPLEGVFEAGAGLQFDYEQSTAGVEETFNRYTPDTPSGDDLIGAATSAAPLAAAEPTPAGEVAVAGVAAIGGVVLAGEALSQRTSTTGGVTSTEVEIPENADGQFRNELEISGSSQQFVNELGVPDQSEQMAGPFGVPEQGITIDPEQNVAPWETDPEEMPVEGDQLFVDEMDVPSEDTEEVTLDTQQLVGDQQQRPTSREEDSGFQRDRQQPAVPEDLVPDRDVVIGEETPAGGGLPSIPSRDSPGLIIGGGSGVQFIGRRARPDRTMTDAEDAFLGVDLADPYDSPQIRESAEQSTVGGSQTGPLAGVGASSAADADVGVGPRDAARTAPTTDAGPGVAEDAATAPATISDAGAAAGVEAPGLTTDAPGFGAEPVTANAFAEPTAGIGMGFGEGGSSGRRDRPDFTDFDADDERDDGPVFFESGRQFERELADPLGGQDSGGSSGGGGLGDPFSGDESDQSGSDSDSIFGGFL